MRVMGRVVATTAGPAISVDALAGPHLTRAWAGAPVATVVVASVGATYRFVTCSYRGLALLV